nr:uncharacterized protein [uncultured bacterium]
MLVKANQVFEVTTEATVASLDKKKVMPGGVIKTLSHPSKGEDGDKILATYVGKGRPGEAPNGKKFWVKVDALARTGKLLQK